MYNQDHAKKSVVNNPAVVYVWIHLLFIIVTFSILFVIVRSIGLSETYSYMASITGIVSVILISLVRFPNSSQMKSRISFSLKYSLVFACICIVVGLPQNRGGDSREPGTSPPPIIINTSQMEFSDTSPLPFRVTEEPSSLSNRRNLLVDEITDYLLFERQRFFGLTALLVIVLGAAWRFMRPNTRLSHPIASQENTTRQINPYNRHRNESSVSMNLVGLILLSLCVFMVLTWINPSSLSRYMIVNTSSDPSASRILLQTDNHFTLEVENLPLQLVPVTEKAPAILVSQDGSVNIYDSPLANQSSGVSEAGTLVFVESRTNVNDKLWYSIVLPNQEEPKWVPASLLWFDIPDFAVEGFSTCSGVKVSDNAVLCYDDDKLYIRGNLLDSKDDRRTQQLLQEPEIADFEPLIIWDFAGLRVGDVIKLVDSNETVLSTVVWNGSSFGTGAIPLNSLEIPHDEDSTLFFFLNDRYVGTIKIEPTK